MWRRVVRCGSARGSDVRSVEACGAVRAEPGLLHAPPQPRTPLLFSLSDNFFHECPSSFSSSLFFSVSTYCDSIGALLVSHLSIRRVGSREIKVCRKTREICSPSLTHASVCSLVLRFVKDQFDDYRESTIGGMITRYFCPRCTLTITCVRQLHSLLRR